VSELGDECDERAVWVAGVGESDAECADYGAVEVLKMRWPRMNANERKWKTGWAVLLVGLVNAQQPTDVTFKTSTQLVVEAVVVKDKSGKPIEGLTAKDFTVTEDGVPQTIKFFEYQKLPEEALPPPALVAEHVEPLKKYPKSQISQESPGSVKYRDRRLLAMYFDMTSMPEPDQARALESAKKFIKTQMTAADLMAIMMYSGSAVQVLQDFT